MPGRHVAPFVTQPDAGAIADAFRNAIYADDQADDYFGIPLAEFCNLFHQTSQVAWGAGDEAFDDGSYVLQFDVDSRVRLIAFKSDDGYGHVPGTLRDVWLPADDFYNVLHEWHEAFEAEWMAAPKFPETS